jgi:hypothetical protein
MAKGLVKSAVFVLLMAGAVQRSSRATPPPAPAAAAADAAPREVVEKYDDGAVHVRYVTDEKGVRNGAYEELYPNGRAKVRGTYAAGERTGAWQTFDEAGKVVEAAAYRKDVLDGNYTWSEPGPGKRQMRGTYRQGALIGFVEVLGEKGTLARTARYPRPMAQVREMWSTLYPNELTPPKFLADPSAAAPYKAGRVAPESLEEALKVAKLYRYLSGVPWQHLRLDAKDTEVAQYGAVLLQKLGMLTHTPAKPADMDDAFFKRAYAGCNESNIHRGQTSLVSAVRGFMDDSDGRNIALVGHRRWILKPGLKQVGFGHSGGFSTMHVNDKSRDVPNFEFVAFPGEGYYPLQLVEKHYAWSAHFHQAKLLLPPQGADAIKVKVTRLDEHFQPGGDPAEARIINAFPDQDQGWNTVVFSLELKKVEAGRYWVELAGLRNPRGAAPVFGYLVELVDMKATATEVKK